MAEKPVLDRTISVSSESVRIPFTFDEIQARFLAVDIEIETRADSVGTAVFDRYVPRIWSGYWYLVNNNSIKKYGAIEFKRQRIYEKEFPNLAYGMNNAFFDAGAVFGLELELDDLKAWYAAADFLANEDNDANGLYLAHPISELIIYIPVGVDLEVKISRQAYPEIVDVEPSSNPVTGLDGELITPNPAKPLESVNSDILEGIDRPPTLDDYVRDKGYILNSECNAQNSATLKDWIDNTRADMDKILAQLLANGAISQADIDAIRAENPSISDEDLLKGLIDAGFISPAELSIAIEKALFESKLPPDGKKAAWIVQAFGSSLSCVPEYRIRFLVRQSLQQYTWTTSQVSSSPFTPATVNWSSAVWNARDVDAVISTSLQEVITRCGEPYVIEAVRVNGETSTSKQVTRVGTSQTQIEYWIQP